MGKPSKSKRNSHLMVYRHHGETRYNSPDNGRNDDDFSWLWSTWTYGQYGGNPLPFLSELDRRGYDISTLKFSVRLKNEDAK